ncbi:MAG: L-fucose/L-arabinose isomerase family protein [Sphaerochaetaceae bacterium]|jgi:L-arabinose isomerase|nr:L-fucose/L-arabinose isomerase family protein [Sphaerochaetaceae bacterium]MDD2406549.1 L-fucose/L-arabinose isomerase family protein [Sphaerochaetaceae bacterium]MDD3670096.1 L-fucose/L-arabinose isomerase family protein [Sphaerochaetaceae bacterium]MDD4260399.1 L-fucose/L-arabinose isomerase family protein [Sphaerochaetaceae bacterium]NLO59511.1 arabinose isomerase [Spirochaetales bacterium]
MRNNRKPKIGLLGIMHGLYDEKQPEITAQQEKFARDVVAQLKDVADITFGRAAKTRADIEEIMAEYNHAGYDGIMIVMLLYSPGFRLIGALRENRLPIMLANIQPLPVVTPDWDWARLTTNQGIHGAQDTANMLYHAGVEPAIITEDWKSPAFKEFFADWAKAAQAYQALKKMRLAVFGRMKGMGDIVGNDEKFFRMIGPEVFFEGIGDIYKLMKEVTDKQIADSIAEDHKNFQVDPKLTLARHQYAARMQLAFERFLINNDFDGFSANFGVFEEDGRFEQIHMLAGSNLMAKGYAYSNEGDVHTAAMVGAGHVLVGDAHFTEMYSLDYEKDSALMSHMGEGNWKIARKDRPIKLIDRELEIGGLDNPPTVVFSAQPGPGTLVTLIPLDDVDYRLVISEGTILDTPEYVNVPMTYFHFRPDTGIRSAMDNWMRLAGTHHQTLVLGRQARRWEMLCDMLKIDYARV